MSSGDYSIHNIEIVSSRPKTKYIMSRILIHEIDYIITSLKVTIPFIFDPESNHINFDYAIPCKQP